MPTEVKPDPDNYPENSKVVYYIAEAIHQLRDTDKRRTGRQTPAGEVVARVKKIAQKVVS